jgi:hypothetical protein
MTFHRYVLRDFLQRFIDAPDECQFFKVLTALPQPHQDGPWIAGGALRRTLQQQPLESDVDYFFRDAEQKQTFHDALLGNGGWLISEKEHATTFGVKHEHNTVIVQAVTMAYYPSVEAVLDSFDFTITQFAYDGADLICGPHSLWDLARKRLALHKLTFGVSTVRRLIKYTRQGFTACGGVLASILEETVAHPEVINREVTYVD